MVSRMSAKLKRPISAITFIIAMLMLIVLGILVKRFYSNLNQQLFKERQEHLIEYTQKTAQLIGKSNDNAVNQLKNCIYAFSETGGRSGAKLSSSLDYLDGLVGDKDSLVILFDTRGNYYASDGVSGYWEESDFLQDAGDTVSIGVMSCPHENDKTRMIYVQRLEEPIEFAAEDKTITHIAIAIDSEKFKNALSITGYGENCYSYLTNEKGRRIYQYEYDNSGFLDGYNLLHAIEEYEVIHPGNYDSLTAAIDAHDTDAFEFEYEDEETGGKKDWFVGLSYVEDADWVVLLLVPTDAIGAGTASMFSDTASFFMSIAIILVIIFIFVIWMLMRSREDQRQLARQEETGRLLKEAADKAEAANKAKTEFLSHMSHDIRTPINAIMGMTDIALKNADNEEKVRDCLGKIDGASGHLLSLVNDVLDMSRIESGNTTMSSKAFNLKECLNNCASIISGQLVNRDITLVRDFEGIEAPAVMGDELHLRQIFINILGNSVKFTPDGGSITFRAWEEEGDEGKKIFVFDLSDTGIGMSEEYLPKLFEAFSQEEGGSRTTYKGTGLGMAITKSFVDLMGGSIEVESKLNCGSRFLVKIPMEITDLQDETYTSELDYGELKGIRVLLAEDNELNAEIAEGLLAEVGIITVTVHNGREAVERFRESALEEFDAILMDIMMPEMNGYEAAAAIRTLDRGDAAAVPIIALSANAYEEDIRKAKESGMNAHIAKPVDSKALYKELLHYTARADREKEISLKGMSVLVAEDNELNAEIMLDILKEAGMAVKLVNNGKEALDEFISSKVGQYELILMDMQMPVMDGVTAVREIRKSDRADAGKVPIFALTANTFEEAGSSANEAGMSGFLMKPLKIEDIITGLKGLEGR